MPVLETSAECRVLIDNKEIKHDVSSVRLDQYVDDHHLLILRLRRVGKVAGDKDFEDPSPFTKFLGKPLALTITPLGGVIAQERKLEFIGLVTQIGLDNSIDGINEVLVTAHSPTITADGAHQNALYHEQKASEIIDSIIRSCPVTVGKIESSAVTHKYVVQYRQTDYEFIGGLASRNGLFACYDGVEFNLSKANSFGSEELVWRESLGAFCMGLGTGIEKTCSQVYDYSKKEVYAGETSGSLRTALSAMSKVSHDASTALYPTADFVPGLKSGSQGDLDKSLETVRESVVGRLVSCSGESIVPAVRVGHCVKIKGMEKLDGQYWIRSVRHVFDESGKYHNSFVCTPLDLAFPERKASRIPFTDLQTGEVMDTDDPDKLGRIKVRFHWNVKDGSPAQPEIWLRVLSSHGGGKRGLYCLPEVGDEVLVGFEHGDPTLPIVLGSLYNGKDVPPVDHKVSWKGADNNLKLFRTKSGNEIYFCDDSGKEAVVIVQKDEKNSLTMTLDGPKISLESQGDISVVGANIKIESTQGDIELSSAANLKTSSSANTEVKSSANMKLEAGANMEIKSSAMMKVEAGAKADLSAGAMMTIKGAMVEIN
ncbi:MAG: type VI secretion system tip protein VgrG [Candidatus Zixiibacteriota bacterium]